MIIESVHVENFRSIKNETLHCGNLTALVGPNGAGKSSLLSAIEKFQSKDPKIESEDYFERDTTKDIVIAITFKELSSAEKQKFEPYIENDKLTVEKVFKWADNKPVPSFHGSLFQNPEFNEIRSTEGARNKKAKYDEIRQKQEYTDLPVWTNLDTADENLIRWEQEHPDKCIRQRSDKQFFGWEPVAEGYLGQFINFIPIHAVREVSDVSSDGKDTPFSQILNIAIRNKLMERENIRQFLEDTKTKHMEIMNPSNIPELNTITVEMNNTLKNYAPHAKIEIEWKPIEEIDIPRPKADISLLEDEYKTTVNRTGHGLQRALIMTLLQYLSLMKINQNQTTDSAIQCDPLGVVLIIDEPEIYQHPNRQRHLFDIFTKLSEDLGKPFRIQIIYSTHSPHFVSIDRLDQIRLLKKIKTDTGIKQTRVYQTSLDKVAQQLTRNYNSNKTFTAETLLPYLQVINKSSVNEGFFADLVVIVEGDNDREAILGVANALGYNFEADGISVIYGDGKSNLDRPATVFKELGIPIYAIWDNDEGGNASSISENKRLLRLVGAPEEDYPHKIENTFSVLKKNLEKTMSSDIGEENYSRFLRECKDEFGIADEKKAFVVSKIIKKAESCGNTPETLMSVVNKIMELRRTL